MQKLEIGIHHFFVVVVCIHIRVTCFFFLLPSFIQFYDWYGGKPIRLWIISDEVRTNAFVMDAMRILCRVTSFLYRSDRNKLFILVPDDRQIQSN